MTRQLLRLLLQRAMPLQTPAQERERHPLTIGAPPPITLSGGELPMPLPQIPNNRLGKLPPRIGPAPSAPLVSGGELPMPFPQREPLWNTALWDYKAPGIRPYGPQPAPSLEPSQNISAPIPIAGSSTSPIPPVTTAPTVSTLLPSAPQRTSSSELPFETFQRLTGMHWGRGNKNPEILRMLEQFGIEAKPGSAEANLALKRALIANSRNIQ